MHKLLEKLDKELHKYADKEGELTKAEWEAVFDAIEARNDLITSMAMEGEDQYGNYEDSEMSSGRRYSSRPYDPDLSYSRRGSYKNMTGMSGTRGMSQTGTMRRGYSGTNYSGHAGKEAMLNNLYMAMDEATSEEERMSIQKCIDKLEY